MHGRMRGLGEGPRALAQWIYVYGGVYSWRGRVGRASPNGSDTDLQVHVWRIYAVIHISPLQVRVLEYTHVAMQ